MMQKSRPSSERIAPHVSCRTLLFTGLALTVAGSAVTAQAPSLMVDVGPCITLETAVERYTCYETQVNSVLSGSRSSQRGTSDAPPQRAAPRPETASGSTATAPQPAPRDGVDNPDDFGFPREVIEQRRGDEQEQTATEVRGVIAEVEQIVPNQYIVTLENGQVWRQSRPDPKMRLQAGQHVRIYPTRWGEDMRMSVEELKGFVQVSRLR